MAIALTLSLAACSKENPEQENSIMPSFVMESIEPTPEPSLEPTLLPYEKTDQYAVKNEPINYDELPPDLGAYLAVLRNDATFDYYYRNNDYEERLLVEFLNELIDFDDESVLRIENYTIIDYNEDGLPAVLIELYFYFRMVFYYHNGKVTGYMFSYREMMDPKKDGTFIASGGALHTYFEKLQFQNGIPVFERSTYSDYIDGQRVFYINDEQVSESLFDDYWVKYDEKEDPDWHEYNAETFVEDFIAAWDYYHGERNYLEILMLPEIEAMVELCNNPIDAYFLPRIEYAADSEVQRRVWQDTYLGVWRAEFNNIVEWVEEMYVHQEHKDVLYDYINSVEQLIDVTIDLIFAELFEQYELPPTAGIYNASGNGTRSWHNQLIGEIYRDAGMRIIENFLQRPEGYVFLDIDYSKEYYE